MALVDSLMAQQAKLDAQEALAEKRYAEAKAEIAKKRAVLTKAAKVLRPDVIEAVAELQSIGLLTTVDSN